MKEISFGGKITCEDFININKYHFRNSNIKTFFAQLGAYLIIALAILDNRVTDVIRLIIVLLISIGLSIITTTIFNNIRISKLKCIYNSSEVIKSDKIYLTKEEGLLCQDKKGNTLIKWKDIYKIYDKLDMILIYTTPIQTAAILKSFFKSEEDIIEFKKILKDKVDSKRIRFKE